MKTHRGCKMPKTGHRSCAEPAGRLLRMAAVLLLWSVPHALAQTPEAAPGGELETEPPTLESTGLGTAVTPVPDEDVMRPTEQGLQFTPALARAFALGWINQNLGDRAELSPDQVSRFSGNIANRTLRMAREDPQATRDALESLFESVIVRGPRDAMDPEIAQKTAERMRPVISRWHEFLDGVAEEDGQSILTPRQQAELRKAVERRQRRLDQIDAMMERWSRGEHQETDRLDRLLDPHLSDDEMEVPQDAPEHPGYRRARRRAGWHLQRIGPGEWLQFVTVVKSSMRFDAEQAARADAVYADYKTRAAAIMIPSWRETLRENRTRSERRWGIKDLPR